MFAGTSSSEPHSSGQSLGETAAIRKYGHEALACVAQ